MGSTLYHGLHVVAESPHATSVGSIRVDKGVITHLFKGSGSEDMHCDHSIDLDGGYVLPGIVDAHMHLRNLGAQLVCLDLRDPPTLADTLELLAQTAAQQEPGTWIVGRGWDQHRWPNQQIPHRRILDDILPENPCYLVRVDGHAAWVNTAALDCAKIDGLSSDPQGGHIEHDPQGQPTGLLIDLAMNLVQECMEPDSPHKIRQDFLRAIQHCRSLGLTGVHDMGLTPLELKVLQDMEAQEELDFRVTVYLFGSQEELEPYLHMPRTQDTLVQVAGVKLFVDGALGSHGALLLEAYHDRPGYHGLLLTPPDELNKRARHIHQAGYQIAIHAIGDHANQLALDAIAHAQGEQPGRGHRVEHAQILDETSLKRFRRLRAVASMQPIHAAQDLQWAHQHLGEKRLAYAYPWAQLEQEGVKLPLGSDAPVESADPWLGIQAAVTGGPHDTNKNRRLSLRSALAGFSSVPAEVVGQKRLGHIKPGYYADFTVVNKNPYQCSFEELTTIKTLQTIIAGKRD
jgi:predicted amidohydrolase YtcJ